ncbi:2-methoxy-6-polyprenyl-1,4-benzoquinol methylase, mitochondrial-like [Ptychodera flava]|uniref:2-methoxy-6-polyprenyl-1,4-benzoquinol methylase, mitochondrial-like n=1 Tax=Ptychodera flava TaxID=63121 RepID=UPI00396A44E5
MALHAVKALRSCHRVLFCSAKRCYSITLDSQEMAEKMSDFGFQKVREDSHGELVSLVFKNVANRYDVMNDVMSAGIHRLWKDRFMESLNPMPGTRLLDVAGGTGDIAFRFVDYIKQQGGLLGPPKTLITDLDSTSSSSSSESSNSETEHLSEDGRFSHVTVVDFNENMVKVGKRKARKGGYTQGLSWVIGDAQELPVEDQSVDAYSIAFGIRNVTDVRKALQEAYRVLVPGGRYMCMEFAQVQNPIIKNLYDTYSLQVIPALGEIFAADWNAYQYLVESIRTFYNQEQFCMLMEEAGFKRVRYEDLNFGIVAIYSGFKL